MKLPAFVRLSLSLLLLSAPARAADPVPLTLDPANVHQLELTSLGDNAWQIRTTADDPYLRTALIRQAFDANEVRILAFDYICPDGLPFQVFFAPTITETGSLHSRLPAAEGWVGFTLDMGDSACWSSKVPFLRMDFGREPGKTIQLRNLRLRPRTEQEARAVAQREERKRRLLLQEEMIDRYLTRTHPSKISRVTVEEDTVRIEGILAAGATDAYLCELALHESLIGPDSSEILPALSAFSFLHALPKNSGTFTLELARCRDDENALRDRLFSRWVIVRADPTQSGRFRLLSHARWADEQPARHDLPEAKPRTIKGLGALDINRPMDDLESLGIDCGTVNIVLNALLASESDPDTIPYELDGTAWHFRRPAVEHLDKTLLRAARRDVVVAAIILINKGDRPRDPKQPSSLLAHPDCEPEAIYAMPDVASPQGVRAYQAALDFLANRYSRPDNPFGRIHHWIMHNEVDMGVQWTNAGPRGPLSYMDLYHKSMRIAHLTARKYDPHAKAFISLTHFWNFTPHLERGYRPKHLLETLLAYGRAEGDFDWALAHHPYPASLLEPKTWLDRRVDFTFDTPLITFRNIEVLDAWVRRPEVQHDGRPRTVWLSEQGLNSRDYSQQSLTEQAAGMAYAWKKIQPLDTIEAFCYHNWIDNAHEGGLLLGLRKLPEESMEPKPIWHLYKALGTPEEDAACDFAKPLINIDTWDAVRSRFPIR